MTADLPSASLRSLEVLIPRWHLPRLWKYCHSHGVLLEAFLLFSFKVT